MQPLKEVQKSIKVKFGSLTKFAALVKMERYDLQKFFAAAAKKMTPEREKQLDAIKALVKSTKVAKLDNEITNDLRAQITQAIEDFGGASYFCQENPQFNYTSLNHIMQGRRKRISASVKNLLSTLNIKTNGEQQPS